MKQNLLFLICGLLWLSACGPGFQSASQIASGDGRAENGSQGDGGSNSGGGGTVPRISEAINVWDRTAVTQAYRNRYLAPQVDMGFTGDVNACNPGTTSLAFQSQVIDRINFFRAMVGVRPVTLTPNVGSYQAAALMMSANGQLSHSPPTTWRCYSQEGASGAGSSNLALGASGMGAIDLYMDDFGAANYAVGHRRWLLNPSTSTFATGDVPGANSLAVWMGSGNSSPEGREFLMWPNEGYFPWSLLPSSARWSVSALVGADFSQVSVSARSVTTGQTLPVTLEPQYSGYGLNTLVFVLQPPARGSTDHWVEVTVRNIGSSSGSRDFVYQVRLMPDL